MTLILSMASNQFCMQVGDRLTTLPDGRKFNDTANKQIIFVSNNAISLISYSGLSYINGFSTDLWISEVLSGVKLIVGGRLCTSHSGQCISRDLRACWNKLFVKLNDAWRGMDRHNRAVCTEITLVGYELRSGKFFQLWRASGESQEKVRSSLNL